MKRRDLLRGACASLFYVTVGCGGSPDGTVTQGSPALPGGSPGAGGPGDKPLAVTSAPDASDARFPQGLASGDPTEASVVLWTRIEADAGDIDVEYVIATDEALTQIIARGSAKALADADHTVRLVLEGLAPATRYFYRFEANGVTTRVARTKTAPAPGDDTPVRFAFASCQDYIGRNYHAWRALLAEGPGPEVDGDGEIDFVLWLGDYVYESVNDPQFQQQTGRNVALPDGLDVSAAGDRSQLVAGTLRDYRALYKTYRSDALLREVHRLYPFVTIWDDHEFANDCWQDHSTYWNEKDPRTGDATTEQNTPRRLAASRAWFEFQPTCAAYSPGAAFGDDIQIYRTLRYGKHVELFMTDERMYRSDHVVPEGPRNVAVGKLTANSMVGSRYMVLKDGFDPLEAKSHVTLLGAKQAQWFVERVRQSSATWKVWANEVQMWQQVVDLSKISGVPALLAKKVYVNCDQWDGYRSERKAILSELSGVENLVVCTGDIHAFFAAELHADFDAPGAKPVGVEFVTAGISSASMKQLVAGVVGGTSLGPVLSGLVETLDQAQLETNPHLRYAKSDGYGFALVKVSADEVVTTFVRTGDPTDPAYAGVLERTRLRTGRGTNRLELL